MFDLHVKANEIGYVKLVINYDLPRSVEGYAQRFVSPSFRFSLDSCLRSKSRRRSKLEIDFLSARTFRSHRVSPAVSGGGRPGVVVNLIQANGGDVEMLRSCECFFKFKCSEVRRSPSSLFPSSTHADPLALSLLDRAGPCQSTRSFLKSRVVPISLLSRFRSRSQQSRFSFVLVGPLGVFRSLSLFAFPLLSPLPQISSYSLYPLDSSPLLPFASPCPLPGPFLFISLPILVSRRVDFLVSPLPLSLASFPFFFLYPSLYLSVLSIVNVPHPIPSL